MQIQINNQPYTFQATSKLGALYTYERVFNKQYDAEKGVSALIELFYAILLNDNVGTELDFTAYLQALDSIFPQMLQRFNEVNAAESSVPAPRSESESKSEKKKEKANP